ncbi:MAG: hypothetical protein NZL93_05170, partial [Chthoniobacterales bacterium]|nr:hypothetical protein [Chthoniobacterales bacterium]
MIRSDGAAEMRGGVNVASGWWIGVMAMVVGFIGVCGQVEPGDERRELALAAWGKIGRQSFGEAQREFVKFLP